jgi:hypothetical protein
MTYKQNNGRVEQRNQATFIGPFKIPTLVFHPTRQADIANNSYNNDTKWCRAIVDWEIGYTMEGRWQDGTSNQLLFGEKHIPAQALRPVESQHTKWNGGYQAITDGNGAANTTRLVSGEARLFARSTKDPNTTLNPLIEPQNVEGYETLGSSHPMVINALLGDGTVRAISKSTQPLLVWRMTNVSDGNTVVLP